MQDTAGIFLISCNRNRFFSDMMDVSMLIQNAKEGCGLDEKELLRQLQEQRAGALETAIAQYGAYVLAVIRNRSRGVLTPEDHEEIASDVFLALWRGAKNITRGQLRPWLGAVARKQTAEAMRKKNVYLPLEDDALITLDRLWEQMVEKERCEALAQALAALPEEDREIFYRFYDLSQTTAQIFLFVELGIYPLDELKVFAELGGIGLADFGVDARIVYVADLMAFRNLLLVGLEEVEGMLIDVVDAFELGAYIDRPRQRTYADFQFAFEFVENVERVAPLAVELIDEDNHRSVAHTAHFHEFAGLLLDTFGHVDNDDDRVDGCQRAVGVFGKVLMARSIQNIDFIIFS